MVRDEGKRKGRVSGVGVSRVGTILGASADAMLHKPFPFADGVGR